MKLIDRRGFTYNVYDMGDGRVLKKEKPLLLQYILHFPFKHSPSYVHLHKRQAAGIMWVFAGVPFLGRPKYESRCSYSQDKVIIFDAFLEAHSLEENKRAIDAYVALIFTTWEHGLADVIYNFTRNAGVYPDGSVALIDFNEVTFQKEKIAEKIREKRWLIAYSYWKDLRDEALKAYYAAAMEKAMTLENLDLYWKDNAKLLDKTQ
jgi:hypothetical protein